MQTYVGSRVCGGELHACDACVALALVHVNRLIMKDYRSESFISTQQNKFWWGG